MEVDCSTPESRKINEEASVDERLYVNTGVHKANLTEIKNMMQEGTKEIETIFQGRVVEMKQVHEDAKKTLEALSRLKDKVSPEVFAELDESWTMTQSMILRTDEIIKAMYGFVSALQCEDRMSQLIDGIVKNMDKDMTWAESKGIQVEESVSSAIKLGLVAAYTIQEQRDFAMGLMEAFQTTCELDEGTPANLDEFTLF